MIDDKAFVPHKHNTCRQRPRESFSLALLVCKHGAGWVFALLLMLNPYDHLTEVDMIVLFTFIIILEFSRGRAICFPFILRQKQPCLSVFILPRPEGTPRAFVCRAPVRGCWGFAWSSSWVMVLYEGTAYPFALGRDGGIMFPAWVHYGFDFDCKAFVCSLQHNACGQGHREILSLGLVVRRRGAGVGFCCLFLAVAFQSMPIPYHHLRRQHICPIQTPVNKFTLFLCFK